jgi:uncharacterized OB-fold protein
MNDTRAALLRPTPNMEGLALEFYDWIKKGELRFQRCNACGTFRHVPRELCARCGGADWEWAKSVGRGRVFTWTTVHRSFHPAFTDTPYTCAVVELEEGPRLLARVVDVPPNELEFDMTVDVVFTDVSEQVRLPAFRRASSRARP